MRCGRRVRARASSAQMVRLGIGREPGARGARRRATPRAGAPARNAPTTMICATEPPAAPKEGLSVSEDRKVCELVEQRREHEAVGVESASGAPDQGDVLGVKAEQPGPWKQADGVGRTFVNITQQ